MAGITVVIGPPCAGKSTYVGERRADGEVVVDYDKIAGAFGSTAPHAATGSIREVAFAARKAGISRILRGVEADAWIIHTSPRPDQMGRYREAGAELVLLDPGMEECLARAVTDNRPEGTADAIRQWYDAPPQLEAEKRETGMRTKDFSARVKAAGPADGLAEGQFVALVSVFGNEDSVGDIVRPGAFTQTLAEWAAKGDPIPVIWAHDWGDPFSHIGTVVKAVETLAGLEVTGQIDDLSGDDVNPTAQQVYRLLKGRRVTQFSFAYDVQEGAWVNDEAHPYGGYYELRRLKLHEVGPCLVGANQETELLAAKATGLARGAKAGRVLSQKNFEALTAAYEAIGEVLDAAQPEKTGPADPGKNDGPGQPGAPAADGTAPSAQPGTPEPAQDPDSKTTTSSTEDETVPDLREAPEGAAKAGAASARLRADLQLLELEALLTE
ncbi:HK97 family phage prohead protease [Streptomyces sp. NPDC006798]|uniref:HK97 family phage prohead protease n=1 Tax=unclassified Streptomyces TaxID=2593676 RepID=UPI00331A6B62